MYLTKMKFPCYYSLTTNELIYAMVEINTLVYLTINCVTGFNCNFFCLTYKKEDNKISCIITRNKELHTHRKRERVCLSERERERERIHIAKERYCLHRFFCKSLCVPYGKTVVKHVTNHAV